MDRNDTTVFCNGVSQFWNNLEQPCRGIDVSFKHTGFEWNRYKILGCGCSFPLTWYQLFRKFSRGKSSAKCALNVFLNKAIQKNKVGGTSSCIITDPH